MNNTKKLAKIRLLEDIEKSRTFKELHASMRGKKIFRKILYSFVVKNYFIILVVSILIATLIKGPN